MTKGRRPDLRAHRARLLAIFIAIVLFSGAILAVVNRWVPPETRGKTCPLDQNAAWIGVEWTSEPVDIDAITQLAQEAADHRLHYLYPYTTYIRADGTFNPTYTYASDFIAIFEERDPDTKLLAWIGLPLVNERPFGIDGWVDLANQQERAAIVKLATRLVREVGFDGVHIDAETVQDGDPGFIALLDETKAAMPSDAILSVAGSYWLPVVINRHPLVRGYKWSSDYYRQVASHVDQIAAMTYDSLMPHPLLYRVWLNLQARAIDRSVRNTGVELLIGISPSRERTLTHHPWAENTQSGLAAICTYVEDTPGHEISGVALYAAWEADANDWQLWDETLSR